MGEKKNPPNGSKFHPLDTHASSCKACGRQRAWMRDGWNSCWTHELVRCASMLWLPDVQIPWAPQNLHFLVVFMVNYLVFRWPKHKATGIVDGRASAFEFCLRSCELVWGLPVGDSHGSSLVGG